MTTIWDFPQELFYLILEQLSDADLLQCQQVCRSWYLPFHLLLLKSVCLNGARGIERFIRSIDHNPDPLYLNSVKQLIINTGPGSRAHLIHFSLTMEDTKKLFFRFPNLETIKDVDSYLNIYAQFNDDLCVDLKNCCPKLQTFKMRQKPSFFFCAELWKLRLVLTDLNMEIWDKTTITTIAGFTNLKTLVIKSEYLDTLEKFLPVFDHLPNLTNIQLLKMVQDQDDFAEHYLVARTKDKQDQLLERLSKITDLTWHHRNGVCPNAIKFIAKYLVRLKRLSISGLLSDETIARQDYQSFCNSISNILDSPIDCAITIGHFEMDDLEDYFSSIFHKVYQNAGKNRSLELDATDGGVPNRKSRLEIIRTVNGQRKIVLAGIQKQGFDKLVKTLLPKVFPLNDIDYFKFHPITYEVTDITLFEKMLDWMNSMKHAYFEIPYFEETTQHDNGPTYPQMEQLTIKSRETVKYQTLLNTFSFALPNLKRLNIYYHCGYWDENLGEFQLDLCEYSLQHLKIDVTPIIIKMNRSIGQRYGTADNDFFVLDILLLATNKRHSYKVTPLSLSIKSIDKDDDLVRGEHFKRLHITAHSLQKLELCAYHEDSFNQRSSNYIETLDIYQTRMIQF